MGSSGKSAATVEKERKTLLFHWFTTIAPLDVKLVDGVELKLDFLPGFESDRQLGAVLGGFQQNVAPFTLCLLYTSPSPRDRQKSRMPSSA